MNNIVKLQNIVLNLKSSLYGAKDLFYRGSNCLYKEKEGMLISEVSNVKFDTYFNSLSYQKIIEYTSIIPESVFLKIEAQGNFTIQLVGLSGRHEYIKQDILLEQEFNLTSRETIKLKFPKTDYTILSFNILTYSKTNIYSGYYGAESESLKEINLAIIAPTYKREESIISNFREIEDECLNSDEIKDHLCVHIVDNGRTLPDNSFKSKKVFIHKNINAGGSGGYARGMMEIIDQNEKGANITHAVLMDDDIIIIPEVIKRTYYLLRILKPIYESHSIAGAMLSLQDKIFLFESLGQVSPKGYNETAFGRVKINSLTGILNCEEINLEQMNQTYAGWWYCVYPIHIIRKDNLPLPLFLRGDDVEFAIRNNVKHITINGIAVWHDSFTFKYNPTIDNYLVLRNNLIIAACGSVKKANYISVIKHQFDREIYKFNYDAAELIINAMEDFLKGPDYITNEFNENVLNKLYSIGKCKETSTIGTDYQNINLKQLKQKLNRSLFEKIIHKITYNGHRLPSCLLKKDEGIIMFNHIFVPERGFLRKKLIAINPYRNTYVIRNMDKKRYRELLKKYRKGIKKYNKNILKLSEQYSNRFHKMKTYEFWKQYLKM